MRVQLMIRGEWSLHLCCIGQRRVRSDIYLTEAQTQPWPDEASLPASLSNILFPLLTWIFYSFIPFNKCCACVFATSHPACE